MTKKEGGITLNRRAPISLALGIVTLLSGCSLFQNSPTFTAPTDQQTKQGQTTPTANASQGDTLVSVDATSLSPQLVAEFHQASELAKEWHDDAQFYAATVSWPGSLAVGHAKRVYVYGSAHDPANWWTVAINEQTNERIRSIIPKEDYLGPNLPAAAVQYWKLNAVEALQIAEKNGGGTFRTDHPEAEVTASLATQGPKGWLWWVVTYRGNNNTELRLRIHPTSGEIYDENGTKVGTTTAPTNSSSTSSSPSTTS